MDENRVILPGETISHEASFLLQGHGTYVDGSKLKASYLGCCQMVNQLAFVQPLHGRYAAQVGDVVVGVVQKIVGNCWIIEIGSAERVQLSIFQVNTEELANRRILDEDLYEMRNIFNIDDVISCEVQRISSNGTVMLQTRTSKYGRLTNGTLVRVKPNLMMRQPKHMQELPCGVSVIFGCNGYIWLSPSEDPDIAISKLEVLQNICTLRNIILALAQAHIKISYHILLEMFDLFKQLFHPGHKRLDKDTASKLLEYFLETKTML